MKEALALDPARITGNVLESLMIWRPLPLAEREAPRLTPWYRTYVGTRQIISSSSTLRVMRAAPRGT